jgi:hypothetical protein
MCNLTSKLRANNNHVTDHIYWLRYKASWNTQNFSRYFEAGLIRIVSVLPWLRRLGNKLLVRNPGLNPRPVHVGFMADGVALKQVFLPLFSVPLSVSVPRLLHTYSPIHLSSTLFDLSNWVSLYNTIKNIYISLIALIFSCIRKIANCEERLL